MYAGAIADGRGAILEAWWIATLPGHANRRHSANEYIQLQGYKKSIEFTIRLMWRIGLAKRDPLDQGAD